MDELYGNIAAVLIVGTVLYFFWGVFYTTWKMIFGERDDSRRQR